MLQLFSDTSFKLSKRLTNSYSTSFSWGIKAFSPEYRDYIYAVYGYVRLADEIVDSFHGYNKAELLNNLRKDTWKAIDEGISTNPILQAFQITVNILQKRLLRYLYLRFSRSSWINVLKSFYSW
jgi:phytoene/squalene synthetase